MSPDTSWTHSEPVWWEVETQEMWLLLEILPRAEKYPGFSLLPPGSYDCRPLVDLCRKLVDWQPAGIGLPMTQSKAEKDKKWQTSP